MQATLFNQTEIAFVLMDHGASVECKNAQGNSYISVPSTALYLICFLFNKRS